MKKKIILLTVIGLVLILAGGSAFLYTRMTATEDETALAKVQEAEKTLTDEEISGGDSAGEKTESKIKKEKSEGRGAETEKALENLEKERQETLGFLEQYDNETIKKKERSEAISRWLEKKPH